MVVAHKFAKASIAVLAVVALFTHEPAFAKPSKSSSAGATSSSSAGQSGEEAAVRAQLSALKAAVTGLNAKAVADIWTPDGRYVDVDGNEYVGRDAIQKSFAQIFEDKGERSAVEIIPAAMRFPVPNMALVNGTVKQKELSSNEFVAQSRFSIALVKKDGAWLITSAEETPIAEPADANPLEALSWMIGSWSTENNGGKATMKAEWVPSKNFIFCRYEISKANQPVQIETQIIGWDPRVDAPISWHFDSSGGFGQGKWTKRNNQWIVDASGVERDSSITSATNILTNKDPNDFSFQSVNRHLNGVLLGDTDPLNVHRQNPAVSIAPTEGK